MSAESIVNRKTMSGSTTGVGTFTDYASSLTPGGTGALVASVDLGSPAELAGLLPGMIIVEVDGQPLRDIIDWLWLTDEDKVELRVLQSDRGTVNLEGDRGTVNLEGDRGTVNLTLFLEKVSSLPSPCHLPSLPSPVSSVTMRREPGESWGLSFTDVLFDGLKTCRNSCSFCFMAMLPEGMRQSLYVRDDDYRLSFLQGNFVTLTNLSDEDLSRIIEYRLSPLHVSLHATDPELRLRLIGSFHARGIEALEQLLEAGIEIHVQVVVIPSVNDGLQLDKTLSWIEEHSGIRSVGIVPYGFTQFAKLASSFDADAAQALMAQVAPYQQRSLAASGTTRFQLADEWFLLAGLDVPSAEYYDGFPQYEDGIGMLRSFIDDYAEYEKDVLIPLLCDRSSVSEGRFDSELAFSCHPERKRRDRCQGDGSIDTPQRCQLTRPPDTCPPDTLLVTGEAFAPMLKRLTQELPVEVVAVKNRFFGGNVDVAGLLTAQDIIGQLVERGLSPQMRVVLPSVLFNADSLTLDDKQVEEIAQALKCEVVVVPCLS